MKEYRALIANCLITGELPSTVDGKQIWNVINLTLDGFDAQLVQRPEFMGPPNQYDGETHHTTDLVIPNLETTDFDRAQLLAYEVARLLAFATVSEVWAVGYSYPYAQPAQQTRPYLGRIYAGKPVIDTRSGQSLRIFLEQAWPVYHAIEQKRQLNIVFDYFVLSQLNRQPIEIQLVITFVLLENLKSTYAFEQGIPFENGRFRKRNNRAFSFEELLEKMLTKVGMSANLSRIVKLRNDIIHSGIAHSNPKERIETWLFAQDIIREYLLRLLGYKGECQLYLQARFVID